MELLTDEATTIAACLMPDHLHWLLSEPTGITARVARFKSLSTRVAWRFDHRGSIWQRSFWDRVVRGECDLYRTLRYVVANPWRDERCAGTEDLRVVVDHLVIHGLLHGDGGGV